MKTALITGATSGIGYELARLFAGDGHRLVLISRSEATLADVSASLRKAGAPEVLTIAKDLAVPGVAEEIYQETTRLGIEVNFLVNNAGLGEHGYFNETDLQKELNIVQLNIAALVTLTKLYLHDMVKRDEGRILQVASMSSYQPKPKLAVYAASKAFVLSFSDALIKELRDSNVTITVLMPAPTDTDFYRKANMDRSILEIQQLDDPADVARTGYKALMNGEKHALRDDPERKKRRSTSEPRERRSIREGSNRRSARRGASRRE